MKIRILQEFINSNLEIKSIEKLELYIEYCILNNQETHTPFETELHHILPKAKDCFPEYKNLKINSWNGTYLNYEDHYKAHELLFEAINSYSVNYSYNMLSNFNKNTTGTLYLKAKILSNLEHSKFQNSKGSDGLTNAQRAGIKISEVRNSKIWKDTIGKESIIKQKLTKKSEVWKQEVGYKAIEKARKTNSEIQENGKTKSSNNSLKSAETCRNTITENGKTIRENMTENYKKKMKLKQKEVSLNMAKSRHITQESGLTSFQEGAIKGGITRREKGRYFQLFSEGDIIINEKICLRDLCKMSQVLIKSTKENPMGCTKRSKNILIKNNKENLIGLYTKEII